MDSSKKILVVVYRFPPMGGVGSRRWAKSSKYLARAGWDVHVITTHYPWVDAINWNSDVDGAPGITVARLRSGYPSMFMRPYRSRLARAAVRICRMAYDKVIGGESALDYASAWTEGLVSYAVDYIRKHGISNVVVSGPPSSLHLSGAMIKSEVPAVRLIQDYRDPWSNVHDYSMRKIGSAAKKLKVMHAESMALQAADKVVVVSQQMAVDLSRTFALPQEKIEVIYNGFDVSDFDGCAVTVRNMPSSKIRIGYFGAIGRNHGRMKALEMIADVLQKMGEEGGRFEFVIHSDLPSDYFFSSDNSILRNNFKCLSMVSRERMMEIIGGCDVCLAINAQEDSYAIASKVYEYMGAAKPIMLVSPMGEAAQLLEEAGQYTADYSVSKIQNTFKKILQDHDCDGGSLGGDSPSYAKFDLEELSKKYACLLNQ
jgi:glycosyltransferase involved in cell wall biosynthesis